MRFMNRPQWTSPISIYRRFEQLAEEKGYDGVVAATHFD